MTKDTIILGTIAGLIGNIPKTIIDWTMHSLGLVRYTFAHIAAGYFVSIKYIDNPVSLATGFISDFIMAGFLGSLFLIILRISGKDYPVTKGILFSAILYVILYGLGMALNLTRVTLATPLPNLLLLLPHLVFGATMGFFLKRYDQS